MNIDQQRSNFEDYELKKKTSSSPKILFQRFEVEYLGVNEREYVGQYISSDMQEKWELWLAAQQQEGYVLVPVEPTKTMIRVGEISHTGYDNIDAKEVYKTMIGVAQE